MMRASLQKLTALLIENKTPRNEKTFPLSKKMIKTDSLNTFRESKSLQTLLYFVRLKKEIKHNRLSTNICFVYCLTRMLITSYGNSAPPKASCLKRQPFSISLKACIFKFVYTLHKKGFFIMDTKLVALSNWMVDTGVDFTFLTSTDSIFYFSGFYSDPHERLLALIAFPTEEPILVCPSMEQVDAKNAGWKYDIIGYSDTDNPWDTIKTFVNKRTKGIRKVALEKDHMNVSRYESLLSSFPSIEHFRPVEEKINTLRMVKSPEELMKIREACKWADFAIEVGCNEISEGKTEMEILATIEYELKKKGIGKMSFSTMVLTGKNGASPHGNPGETKVKKGDFVLFDLGVVVDGYCSDITRTVAYGSINEQQQEIYDTVLKAQLAAIDASKPSVACSHIDLTARNIIRDAGYGEFFPHRLGHGLGISVHEYPSLTETNDLKLKEGMVYTIEPGIYVPEVAGVRIEDDLYVTSEGVEILTKFPKELVTLS